MTQSVDTLFTNALVLVMDEKLTQYFPGAVADYAVSMGAAAVDLELSNHRDTDFEMNLKILLMFMNWER